MAYADLTSEQKESLAKLLMVIRPKAGEVVGLLHRLKLMSIGTGRAFLEGVLPAITAEDYVPKEAGLGLEGMTDLTKADIQNLIALNDALVACLTDARLASCVNAAGPKACAG